MDRMEHPIEQRRFGWGEQTPGGVLEDFLAACVRPSGGLASDGTERRTGVERLSLCPQSQPAL